MYCLILNKGYIFLYFITACLLLTPLSASARSLGLDALARLSYSAYDGGTDLDHEKADSFSQSYSVTATKKGNLYNRRGGPYSIAFGYNHLRYLTNVNNTKYSPSISVFRWSGNLRLSMPHLNGLSLSIYSNSISDIDRNKSDLGDRNWGGFVYDLDLRHEIKTKGFDLKLGVNGGPYYYLYHNNYKILVSEGPDRDFSRIGMSVQYQVNWLHFFRDVESFGGKERRVYSLGNVGLPKKISSFLTGSTYFSEDRYWYRLTNWLQISTDLLVVDEKGDDGDTSAERATIVLRGAAGRGYGGSFSTHERYDSNDVSRRSLSLPFWAGYNFSPSTRTYFVNNYSEAKSEDHATSAVTRAKHLVDNFTLISDKKDRYYLETGYGLEKSNTSTGEMESHSVNFGVSTRLKDSFDYGLTYRYGTNKVADKGTENRSSSQALRGNIYYRTTPQTRMSLSQLYLSLSDQGKQVSELFTTDFTINHNSKELSSYLVIKRSNSIEEGGAERMTYSTSGNAQKDINGRLSLSIGLNYSKEDVDGVADDSESISQIGMVNITYIVARNLNSKTLILTNSSDQSGTISGSASTLKIREDLKYTYYLKGFSKRKLFDIGGAIESEKSKANGSRYDRDAFNIGFNYYPARFFSCGASYAHSSESDLDIKRLYFGLTYPLLALKGNWSSNGAAEKYRLDLVKKF